MKRPHDNCYWVLPGRLMAGEYPIAIREEDGRKKLSAIVAAGINHFIDLTHTRDPLDPYVELLRHAVAHTSAAPGYDRFAITDMGIPESPELTNAVLDRIDDLLAEDRVPYIHCWGGIGRTGRHLAPCVADARSDDDRVKREAQLARSAAWMDGALKDSIREALCTPWILDCDTTVKVLYGHQDGAEIGYNPTKPGRPSHTIHTYWIANVRLVLDAEVREGTATAAKYSLPRLIQILVELPTEQRPRLVRGDNAFGNEPVPSCSASRPAITESR